MKLIIILSLIGLVGCGELKDQIDTDNIEVYSKCKSRMSNVADMGGIEIHSYGPGFLVPLHQIGQGAPWQIVGDQAEYKGCSVVLNGSFEYANVYDMTKTCKFVVRDGQLESEQGCEK